MPRGKDKLLLNADGRVWISTSEGKLIGIGRVELLEKIKEFGSIRQAAMAMQMSYRQAWQLIDDMNSKTQAPVVISSRGGKGGGNATITEKGEELITLFNTFHRKFQKFLLQQEKLFNI